MRTRDVSLTRDETASAIPKTLLVVPA